MGIRNTQDVVEVLAAPTSTQARNTMSVVEVLVQPTNARMRNSMSVIEVLTRYVAPVHAISGHLKDSIINHVFRSGTFAKPTGLSIALYTSMPSDTDPGVEVTGGSYARVAVPPLDSNWAAPSAGNGITSNLVAVTFPVPTVSWDFVVGYGIIDALIGGNLLAWSTLTTPTTVGIGTNPRFVIGALTATFG
jgi:hypothetical protein